MTVEGHRLLAVLNAEPADLADAQLRLDGTATTPYRPVVRQPLSAAQRAILRHLGEHGSIRAVDAGAIVHECRPQAHAALARDDLGWYLASVRPYRSSDGSDCLKRLAERGLVRRVEPGRWVQA